MTDEPKSLSRENQILLLKVARESLIAVVNHSTLPNVMSLTLDKSLLEPRACFISFHKQGELRGCTGVLSPRSPLIEEVKKTTAQTALHDPRFNPIEIHEVDTVEIEISVLSTPYRLDGVSPEELPKMIRPFVDGVTIYRGFHRATFLPQVWNKISDPHEFLNALCQKAGLSAHSWKLPGMDVEVYQVEEFSETLHRRAI
jgi:AmmeMemoRadiSam system protein A